MRKLAIALFLFFLALIIGPDAMPGVPLDDIVYAIIDIFLSYYILKKRDGEPEVSDQ